MKKCFLMILIFLLTGPVCVFADGISAEYACVMEPVTKTVVYEKNAHTRYSMASTTKIMTALLAVEQGCLDDVVTVSRSAAGQEGSSIYLRAGDQIVMRDLLYGLMLNSGNDAAVAVAEHISGNVTDFAALMTEKAREIGAKDTCFQNPNGLDQEGHYTTAYDLALITAYAMQRPEFCEIVSTKSKTAQLQNNQATLYFTNHNKMLSYYDGAIGVKTGFTKATGRCLVSAAERDNMRFIAVTLKAPDDWNDHKKMLDEAFARFVPQTIIRKGDVLKEKSIGGNTVQLLAGKDVSIPVEKNTAYHAEVLLNLPQELLPPVNEGEKVGEAQIKLKNEVVDELDILAGCAVEQKKQNALISCICKILNMLLA